MSKEGVWKTRVYLLTETGDWEDCGTGILTIVKEQNPSELIQEYDLSDISISDDLEKSSTYYLKVLTEAKDSNQSKIPEKIVQKMVGNYQCKEGEHCVLYSKIHRDFVYSKQGFILFI